MDKRREKTKVFLIILFIGFSLLVIGNNLATIEAKPKYKDFYITHDGTILTKDEFIQRSVHCQGMKLNGLIEPVNCHEWVLTEEGEKKLAKYIVDKAMKE